MRYDRNNELEEEDKWKMSSDPPEFYELHPPNTPAKQTFSFLSYKSGEKDSEIGSHNKSIVNDILTSRSNKSYDMMNPLSSSPIRAHENTRREQQNKLKAERNSKRSEKIVKSRGGLDAMEQFIMENERSRKMKRLEMEANQYVIPSEYADNLEQEQEESLEDEDLMKFIESKEIYELELERLLSEFSVT